MAVAASPHAEAGAEILDVEGVGATLDSASSADHQAPMATPLPSGLISALVGALEGSSFGV